MHHNFEPEVQKYATLVPLLCVFYGFSIIIPWCLCSVVGDFLLGCIKFIRLNSSEIPSVTYLYHSIDFINWHSKCNEDWNVMTQRFFDFYPTTGSSQLEISWISARPIFRARSTCYGKLKHSDKYKFMFHQNIRGTISSCVYLKRSLC